MRVMEGTCTCTTRFDATNAHRAFKPQEVKTVQRGLALSAGCIVADAMPGLIFYRMLYEF